MRVADVGARDLTEQTCDEPGPLPPLAGGGSGRA